MRLSNYLRYPVEWVKEGKYWEVRVKGISGVTTFGESKEEALDMALEALILMATDLTKDGQLIPKAPEIKDGEAFISVSATTAIKFMLRNAMNRKGIRVTDLAKQMGCSPQSLNTTLDFSKSATRFEALWDIAQLQGFKADLELSEL